MVYAFKFELDFAASFAFIRFMQSEIYAKKRREKKMQKISYSFHQEEKTQLLSKNACQHVCKIKEVRMTKFFLVHQEWQKILDKYLAPQTDTQKDRQRTRGEMENKDLPEGNSNL